MTSSKILIVEDEMILAVSMRITLEEGGFTVSFIVPTGEEALLRVADEPPDLVLMDIKLAGKMDGVEAARQIKRIHNIPVVFLTGNTDNMTIKQALDVSPSGFLQKPVEDYELVSAVVTALKLSAQDTVKLILKLECFTV